MTSFWGGGGGQCVIRVCIYTTWVQDLAPTLRSWLSWASKLKFLASVSASSKIKFILLLTSEGLLNMNCTIRKVLRTLPDCLWHLEHAAFYMLPSTHFVDKGSLRLAWTLVLVMHATRRSLSQRKVETLLQILKLKHDGKKGTGFPQGLTTRWSNTGERVSSWQ